MQNGRFIRRCQTVISAVVAMVFMAIAVPAVAQVRTTLSFFSLNDIRQGQMGAIGTTIDPDYGEVISGSRACCFSVTAATSLGAPFEIRRTFSSLNTVSQIFYMGVSNVAGQDHLVLALNEGFSTTLVGREFGTAFSGFVETKLMSDLFAQFDQSLSIAERIAASDRLGVFQDQVFALNAGFGVPDRFALTSFSQGVPAGTGFATLVTGAVPEPATWATMILGIGAAGGSLRRRRSSKVTTRVAFA